ncbi:MAG: hypothetical protein R2681_00350 [Pyrinomonadaceae bacterium]
MKVEETVNTIKISETPGCLWGIGIFFIVIAGMLLWGTLGGFSNWDELETWELVVAFLIAVSGIAAGVWAISGGPVARVVIDRVENTVSVKRFGFFGKQNYFYRFDEIRHFYLMEDTDSDGEQTWLIGMRLNSGETIPVNSLAINDEEIQRGRIFQINSFMRKEMPSYEKNLKLSD